MGQIQILLFYELNLLFHILYSWYYERTLANVFVERISFDIVRA